MATRQIPVSKGTEFALVDEEDFEHLSQFSWHFDRGGYVRRKIGKGQIFMHQEIMGKGEQGLEIDHINRVKTDNRRSNLRWVTHAENMRNRGPYKMGSHWKNRKNKHGYRGIRFVKEGVWSARLWFDGKFYEKYGLSSKEEAALAYNQLAKLHHGEFAILNDLSTLQT